MMIFFEIHSTTDRSGTNELWETSLTRYIYIVVITLKRIYCISISFLEYGRNNFKLTHTSYTYTTFEMRIGKPPIQLKQN
jgi:hypothetical protein